MSHPIDWTAAMDATLRRMRREGQPAPAIAAALGLSKNVVLNRCDRLGLPTGAAFRQQPHQPLPPLQPPPGDPSWERQEAVLASDLSIAVRRVVRDRPTCWHLLPGALVRMVADLLSQDSGDPVRALSLGATGLLERAQALRLHRRAAEATGRSAAPPPPAGRKTGPIRLLAAAGA